MISRILHTVAPSHLAILKQEFTAYLVQVSAFQYVTTRPKLLENRLDGIDHDRVLHVFRRFVSHVERSGHSQEIMYFLRRVCVDWKRTCCFFHVEWNHLGLSMSNDGDLCRWFKFQ